MAKQVTVLGLEGDTLRGVRLDMVGDGFVRGPVESWPLAGQSAPKGETEAAEEFAEADGDAVATEEVVDEDKPLARAFRAAAQVFGTNEVVLSLPLSKFLVKTVRLPAEAREDVLGAAQLELDGISPFPDEVLTPGAEIVAEDEKDVTAVMAALPDAASLEVSEALEAAKVHVLRTDATALGWLRGLWPRLCEKQDAARRLVLLNLDEGWDLVVLDEGAPNLLRGIGAVSGPAELGREVMLSLLSLEGGRGDADDVVVCSRVQPEADVLARLAEFGPVRVVLAEDDFAGVEGAARRTVEGAALDVTPVAWSEARIENRFRRKLFVGLAVAGGIWLALMGVLYGVDATYDLLADHQKSLQAEKAHARAFKDVSGMTNRVALIERYADHRHSALEVLRTVTSCLPDADDIAFRSFKYSRDESVKLNVNAAARTDLYSLTESLTDAKFDDDEPLFAKVDAGNEQSGKKGVVTTIDCFFHSNEEEQGGRRGK